MPPSPDKICSIFKNLALRPTGYVTFFDHVSDSVIWEITGNHALSGTWTSKDAVLREIWSPINSLIADPGLKVEVVHIFASANGWAAVELKTDDTRTRVGDVEYAQQYCWNVQFDDEEKISRVRAYLDSALAERILGDERARQENRSMLSDDVILAKMPQYPDIPFDPAYKHFLQRFYAITDSPSEHAGYVDCFAPDATVIVGERKVTGRQEIGQLRASMWDAVQQRVHRPMMVYPYGSHSSRMMLKGEVDYTFQNGAQKTVDWVAECQLVKKEAEGVQMEFYRVYLEDDSAGKIRR